MGSKFKPNYKKENEPISIYKDTQRRAFGNVYGKRFRKGKVRNEVEKKLKQETQKETAG
jgi:hypothetical protein